MLKLETVHSRLPLSQTRRDQTVWFQITVVWDGTEPKSQTNNNKHCPILSLISAIVWAINVWDNENELYSCFIHMKGALKYLQKLLIVKGSRVVWFYFYKSASISRISISSPSVNEFHLEMDFLMKESRRRLFRWTVCDIQRKIPIDFKGARYFWKNFRHS